MKSFIKSFIANLLISFCLIYMSFSTFAASSSFTETVKVVEGFVIAFPSHLPAIYIDDTNLSSGYNYSYDTSTGNFTTKDTATTFCVYSNSSKALKGQVVYSLAIDGTTARGGTALKGTSASNYTVLPYNLTITDGAKNSTTYTIDSSNATSKVSGSSKFIASNVIGCGGSGAKGKGTISFQIKGSDWQKAPADSYSANISLTASQL